MTTNERKQIPGVFVAHSDFQEEILVASPKRVLLQFRVIANAVRSSAPHSRPAQPVAGRKLLALSAIADKPGMGVNELAKALGVRQPTASQVVKTLAALHLVDVQRDGPDRRTVQLHANAEGQLLLRALPAHFNFGDRLPDALKRLDDRSLSRLEAGLTDIVRALGTSAQALATDVDGTLVHGPRPRHRQAVRAKSA